MTNEDPERAGEHQTRPAAARVLVVEDDFDAAESTRRLLATRGAVVRVAYSGGEALELFREERPDIALVDLRLGDMDGCELAALFAGANPAARLLLVAISGSSDPADAERARRAGFAELLVKPVEPAALFALLERRSVR